MRPELHEKTLIQQARAGDEFALEELYRRHVDAIYRYMLYHTGDVTAAEDLTAEVFTQMLTAIVRYQERGAPFEAWLFSIARARRADYWRKIKRRSQHEVALVDGMEEILAGVSLEDRFAHETLLQALQYLTPAEREAIALRFAGGLSHREIAQVVRSNPNAVKSRVRRALTKLRGILERRAAFIAEGDVTDETYA